MKPDCGIYPGLPCEQYHALDAASNSRLTELKRSPKHMRYAVEFGNDTDAKARGDCAHAALLQPERFAAEYAIGPHVKLNTKAGKDEWEAFAADNAGKTLIRGAEGAKVLGIREAVWAHPQARKLLEAAGETELSVVWDDPATGVRCKMRADHIAEKWSTVVDVKTTRDAAPDAFARAACQYGYFRQAAFYLDGLARSGRSYERFAIIAVESEPPHGVIVYQVRDEALVRGAAELKPLLARYARCEQRGEWKGYDEDIQWLDMPEWAYRLEQTGL